MQRTIFNPLFKDTVTFVRTSAETNGVFSEMEVTLGAHGGNPLHKHTAFTETFTALKGNLNLGINGKKVVLMPGERITIQKGDIHRFYNANDHEIKFHLLFTPGHAGAENMLRIMYGLARDGKTNKEGIPKSLSTIALLGDIGDSALPGIFSLLSPILVLLAKRARKSGLEKLLVEKYCQ